MNRNPQNRLLVGFVGATGCGKTTMAHRLVERHSFVRVHMGQPIKDMLAVLGLSSVQLNGAPEIRLRPSALLGGKSPRRAMETLGTDWGRDMISPDIWANAVEARILNLWTKSDSAIVIDDLRFPNDWEMMRRLGGVLVRITRPTVSRQRTWADNIAHRSTLAQSMFSFIGVRTRHKTEFYWQDAPADIDLLNDRSIEALEQKLNEALTSVVPSFRNESSPSG